MGDEVLIAVSNCFVDTVRELDFVSRIGGEEFVVVSEIKSDYEVMIIAEHLRTAVSLMKLGEIGNITASFGVTNLKENENIDIAIGRADKALYIAKEHGKNRVEMI